MRPTWHPRLVNGRYGDPALFVERLHDRSALLFDMGDLGALATRDLLRITHVFVSHMHMDHFVGFDALLRANVGRPGRILVAGPDGLAAKLAHKLAAYEWDLVGGYADDLVFDAVELLAPDLVRDTRFRLKQAFASEPLGERSIQDGWIVQEDAFTVQAMALQHHGVSIGYAVSEPVHVNVWANRVAERGLAPGAWLKSLKEAVRDDRRDDWPIQLPDGKTAPLGSLRELVSVEPGQKVTYVTDVRDNPANRTAIAELCRGADLMFIDSAFAAADRDKADARAHLTTIAAGEIARLAGARRVEPFHFSPRYEGCEAEMLAEVERAFRGR